jgi:hypothetical protein
MNLFDHTSHYTCTVQYSSLLTPSAGITVQLEPMTMSITTNNSMAKQSLSEMENCSHTASDNMNVDMSDDKSTVSYNASFSDSDYDASDFDDINMDETNMFDMVATPQEESAMKNNAQLVRMPGTHGSGGDLQEMGSQHTTLRDFIIRRNSYDQMQMIPGIKKQDKFEDPSMADVDPKLLLKSIIESHGASSEPRPYTSLKGFFATMTEANVAAYDMETVSAIRKGILDDVRKLHEAGKNLVACNKFGESIMHLACRHGETDIVEFLMFEAGSSPSVICDQGRTPMHDACWAAAPNFDCIRLLLKEVPDLLLIADKRGFTPLAYLPRDTWGVWSDFLERNRDILAPKYLR